MTGLFPFSYGADFFYFEWSFYGSCLLSILTLSWLGPPCSPSMGIWHALLKGTVVYLISHTKSKTFVGPEKTKTPALGSCSVHLANLLPPAAGPGPSLQDGVEGELEWGPVSSWPWPSRPPQFPGTPEMPQGPQKCPQTCFQDGALCCVCSDL